LYKDNSFVQQIAQEIPELAKDKDQLEELILRDYRVWQRKYIKENKCVTAKDLKNDPGSYVWYCPPYSFAHLIDVQPPKGSVYIRSVVEPFDEIMDLQFERDLLWLDHFGLQKDIQIHCSGHVYQKDLENMIKRINPEILIPIHTEKPKIMKEFAKKLGVKSIVPKYGQKIPF
jgi:hypothetical protein